MERLCDSRFAGGGDMPDGLEAVRGNIPALNNTNGKIIWNLHTTSGQWVDPHTAPAYNAGANDCLVAHWIRKQEFYTCR